MPLIQPNEQVKIDTQGFIKVIHGSLLLTSQEGMKEVFSGATVPIPPKGPVYLIGIQEADFIIKNP